MQLLDLEPHERFGIWLRSLVFVGNAKFQGLVALFQSLEMRMQTHGLATSVQNRLDARDCRSNPGT